MAVEGKDGLVGQMEGGGAAKVDEGELREGVAIRIRWSAAKRQLHTILTVSQSCGGAGYCCRSSE